MILNLFNFSMFDFGLIFCYVNLFVAGACVKIEKKTRKFIGKSFRELEFKLKLRKFNL